MKKINEQIILSAGDLVNHLSCDHLTNLDIQVATGLTKKPDHYDPLLENLWERGDLHEKAYIQHLNDQGHEITTIEGVDINEGSIKETMEAMQRGDEIIIQASLQYGNWRGRADILRRVETPSDLGDWSYEILDTKLARETKGGTVLQLCLYADLLTNMQGVIPEYIYVVSPWSDFEPQRFRYLDYAAYFRQVKQTAEESIALDKELTTYPEPKENCDICRWQNQCDQKRREDDHLCLVANISKNQIKELQANDINTMKQLASMPSPISWIPKRGSLPSFEKTRRQAAIQVEGRETAELCYEILDIDNDFGLKKLPPPSEGDVFFDIESNQFVGEHGIEYLFGYVYTNENNEQVYNCLWAVTPEEEKAAFESFTNFIMGRLEQYPDMHIYHYAPYEPAALKRLMGRYASCENEIDFLLRGKVFVDLYGVVKNSLRASVESYSLKKLEPFFKYERKISLHDSNVALTKISKSLEFDEVPIIDKEDGEAVENYNSDDCFSTLALRDWLESIRDKLIQNGNEIDRPDVESGLASEELDERQKRIHVLIEKLTHDVPLVVEDRTKEQHARWILAYILDWHRREDKATWWEYFRLRDLSVNDLLGERAAISNLKFVKTVSSTPTGIPIDRYSFESQDIDLQINEPLRMQGGESIGTALVVNTDDNFIEIKKTKATADTHPEAVFMFKIFRAVEQSGSLLRIGEYVAENGIEGEGPYFSARSLLLLDPLNLGGQVIRNEGEDSLDAAIRIMNSFEKGVFPIQGPPGTGKSHTGARMICALVSKGKKVGITANSHKVIRNLINKVIEASEEMGIDVSCIQKAGVKEDDTSHLTFASNNAALFESLKTNKSQVAGATSFLWAREEAKDTLDVLVVDEAAQMSLANVLAVSHVAPALILLGDPQQLEQPTQGTHPNGTESSALDYILDGQETISIEQGLFLDTTWRLHPEICTFNSELFYESKLNAMLDCQKQNIVSEGLINESGLYYVPVEHSGNTSSSLEEVDVIKKVVKDILETKTYWTNRNDITSQITLDDILIIAPYNAHVHEIKRQLPEARVGTVDKFQGQEAPITIYSMATSSSEDAPRGMDFLYSANRLNVAISRAQCASIVIASPKVFEAECRTPKQMKLANAFSRYIELSTEITLE